MLDSDIGDLFAEVEAEVAGETAETVEPGTEEVIEEVATEDNPDIQEPTDDTVETAETDNPDTGSVEAWNWEEYSDQLVPIIVDGKEEMLSLSELRDGGMRQADYTRKTQELASKEAAAQWAQDVQAAWAADPQGTLEAFAKAYNVQGGDAEKKSNALEDLDDDVRPFAEETLRTRQELQEAQRQLQQIQEQSVMAEVRAEVEGLKTQFGADFEPEATLRLAAQKNITLGDAHAILYGQKVAAGKVTTSKVDQQVAEATAAQQRAEAEAKATAKAKAANTQTGSFKASEVPADSFSDIGELAEIMFANS